MTLDDAQSSLARTGLRVVLTALLYWTAGRLALLMAIPPGYATAVWPAAGIALVCCLVWERPVVAGIAIGSFFVNVSTGFDSSTLGATLRSIGVAATIGLGAAGQAALGAALIRRFVGFPTALESVRDIARFTLLGGPLSCTVAASAGVTTLCSAGVVPWSNYAFSWWTWWVGDAIGVLIFGPLSVLLVTASSSHRWRDRTLIVGLPLLVGFGLVTLLFLRTSEWERLRLWTEFERRAVNLSNALEAKLTEYQEVVGDTASLLEVVPELGRAAFKQYTQRALAQHPGLDRLGWIPRVSHDRRADFEAAARSEGYAEFRVAELDAEGSLRAAAQREEYAPAYYLEPEAKNRAALGFDFSSEPLRRTALELATRSGDVTATAPLNLVEGPVHEAGVLLVAPVLSRSAIAGRGGAVLRGYAIGAFVVSDLIAAALTKLEHDDLAITLADRSESNDARTLYADVAGGDGIAHRWSHAISFGGRRWSIELRAKPQYMIAHRSWQAWMVLAAGLLFVALLEVVMLIATGRTAVLRESAERFGALVEASAQIVWTASATGEVVDDSASWRDFTGQTAKQSRGRGWLDALHPDDRPQVERLWREAIVSGKPLHTEYRIRHANGGWRWTAARAVPLLEDAGVVRGWVGMNSDITEREQLLQRLQAFNSELEERVQARTKELSAALREREVMLQEIHHRVKNNLQVISSLINMQTRSLSESRSREALQECKMRVHAIALIHETLYQSRDYARVPFSDYARSLTSQVFRTAGLTTQNVRLEFSIEDIAFPVDRAIPCGLLLNELVTNALKYAFPDGRSGSIRVEFSRLDSSRLRLAVRDDGVGLPPSFDATKSGSLGMQLVTTLAQQLHAQLEITSEAGASFELTFAAA